MIQKFIWKVMQIKLLFVENPKCFSHQMNIYELISVCPDPHNLRMNLETAYSSQINFIGEEGLPIGEHGIGYSNLAFSASNAQKG